MMLFDNTVELQTSDNLLRRFEEIHNYLYANDGLSPEQALEEMIKLLFLKILDERSAKKVFYCGEDEWSGLSVTNKAESLVERLYALFERVKAVYADIFDVQDRIKLSVHTLAQAVRTLQHISFADSSQDAKGLAFQKFLASRDKTGRGQFFTPQPVIDFCVSIMQPRPDEIVIDPACGSGGFLLAVMNHIRKQHPGFSVSQFVAKNLVGCDISASIARIAKMQLLLETDDTVQVSCLNTLEAAPESIIARNQVAARRGGYDIVFANPPFGTTGKITNRQTLSQFDLGYKWVQHGEAFQRTKELQNGQVTEILFLERCLALLREGGRMAIVLPNGYFENSSLAYVRDYIKRHASILGVVHLPQETFSPFGTGVKTSLLFLEKRSIKEASEANIFFGTITRIGYQGNKNGTPIYKKDAQGKRLHDAAGKPILDENYTEIAEAYHLARSGKIIALQNAYTLAPTELNGRFDYDFYSPSNRSLLTLLRHHGAVKLAEIADIVREKSTTLSNPEAVVEYIELSDINTDFFEIINTTSYSVHELPSRASYRVQQGDIMTAVAGNSVGMHKHATAIALEEHEGCICTNGFRLLRNLKIDVHYLLFFLKTEMFLKQVYMLRTGSAIPSISDADFANVLVYTPSESVVKEIAETVKSSLDLRYTARERLWNIRLEVE